MSLQRGEKVETLLNKADELTVTSYDYVKTSKKVKRTMCTRKWKIIMAAVFFTLLLIFLIYMIFIRK